MSVDMLSELQKIEDSPRSPKKVLANAILYIATRFAQSLNFEISYYDFKAELSCVIKHKDFPDNIYISNGQSAKICLSYDRKGFRVHENIVFYVTNFDEIYYERMDKMYKI